VAPARTSADHNSVCPLLPVDIVLVILALLQASACHDPSSPSLQSFASLSLPRCVKTATRKNKKIVFFVSLQHTVNIQFLPLPEFATCQQ
jgi:hypothetical protein